MSCLHQTMLRCWKVLRPCSICMHPILRAFTLTGALPPLGEGNAENNVRRWQCARTSPAASLKGSGPIIALMVHGHKHKRNRNNMEQTTTTQGQRQQQLPGGIRTINMTWSRAWGCLRHVCHAKMAPESLEAIDSAQFGTLSGPSAPDFKRSDFVNYEQFPASFASIGRLYDSAA